MATASHGMSGAWPPYSAPWGSRASSSLPNTAYTAAISAAAASVTAEHLTTNGRVEQPFFAAVAGMLRAAVASHVRLCEGQGDDLLSASSQPPTTIYQLPTANYVSVCERKTGEAFALAAQLGAIAAGADDAPFRRYGLAYGVLFQINDDIADGANPAPLAELKREYEDKTALYRDECALGVW